MHIYHKQDTQKANTTATYKPKNHEFCHLQMQLKHNSMPAKNNMSKRMYEVCNVKDSTESAVEQKRMSVGQGSVTLVCTREWKLMRTYWEPGGVSAQGHVIAKSVRRLALGARLFQPAVTTESSTEAQMVLEAQNMLQTKALNSKTRLQDELERERG